MPETGPNLAEAVTTGATNVPNTNTNPTTTTNLEHHLTPNPPTTSITLTPSISLLLVPLLDQHPSNSTTLLAHLSFALHLLPPAHDSSKCAHPPHHLPKPKRPIYEPAHRRNTMRLSTTTGGQAASKRLVKQSNALRERTHLVRPTTTKKHTGHGDLMQINS